METLKKQTNIRGDVKETDKYWWRRLRNRNIGGDVKETENIGGDVKETDNIGGDVKETDKYWWRR